MPVGNATELNQALKRVEEKDIAKSFHWVFAMLCIVIGKEWNETGWKEYRVGWRVEWNCLERKQCECDYQFFIWFWSVWNVKRIGSGIMWVWMLDPCILHWKSYNKEGRNEVFGCFCCLFTWNYPSRCKSSTIHWFLIQWSGCWFAWWNGNSWIKWRWLIVCLDYGDSTGSREWSHLIGEIDGEVEWWWKGVDLNEWGNRIRCGLISLWLP